MTTSTATPPPAWIERSNALALPVLDVFMRFDPETGSTLGVPGCDERVLDLEPGLDDRMTAEFGAARDAMRQARTRESDPFVLQDVDIVIDALERQLDRIAAEQARLVPYRDLVQTIFEGLRVLLDERNPPARRALAVARLERYAGTTPGATPLTELAMARFRERAGEASLLGPFSDEVEKHAANIPILVGGLPALFEAAGIAGWSNAFAALESAAAAYEDFLVNEVRPRARADFRLPAELYAVALRDTGVDMPATELASRAQVSFREIQYEMQAIAPLVAHERGLPATGYREVLRALKAEQFEGEAILPHYEARLKDLEAIIRREGIVSLPGRDAIIRLAGPAESAASPAPHMDPPRMLGNTGERGVFVLPLRVPGRPGEAVLAYDDFTFAAASWTLTAHEARPGHELQFAAMVEVGVSIARQLFAFNSTNAEGWALYMEAEMKPYEPLDGQLAALQHRLMRAARAYLDPGLQGGTITREEATRILVEDVVLSPAMALQEVERYTFRMPGQATSYFCGYQRLLELRTEVERRLGGRFVRQRYHDFLLAQGLLPPGLLARAVREQFIPGERAAPQAASGS
ncbi:MAG: DUF885 domain-containing protein [Candidatus Eisenbacteria bacterium]